MRCLRFAGLRRIGLVVPSIAAVAAIVIANPASARPHGHFRYLHHVRYLHRLHFTQRHRLALRTKYVTTYPNAFRPLAFAPWQETRGQESRPQEPQWQDNQWRETRPSVSGGTSAIGGMAAAQAGAAGVPVSLVERVIKRESGGNPRAVSRGNYGLMQIRLGTARAMGYTGSAAGLLDPQTNMTYAVRYLAGAYRAAGGNESRAVALYASGYYGVAKRQGFSPYGSSPYGGSYQTAWNGYPEPDFSYRQAEWRSEEPYGRGARYRRWRRHPV